MMHDNVRFVEITKVYFQKKKKDEYDTVVTLALNMQTYKIPEPQNLNQSATKL